MNNAIDRMKKEILELIKSSKYPDNHLFLEENFENDIVMNMLVFTKCFIRQFKIIDEEILNDYISKKFRAVKNGKFDLESYYQNLNEFIFFYYLILNISKNQYINFLTQIKYEPLSPTNDNQRVEYSFDFEFPGEEKYCVNFEMKTITCDPFIKEGKFFYENRQKFIKRFFNDVNLNEIIDQQELDNYFILENSTHYRQLSNNIKKIAKKFSKQKNTLNVGVIVIQFATSLEEFFAYLFHPTKGLLYNLDFQNIDCLVFFSMTPTPDINLEEIYEKNHLFTMLFNGDSNMQYLIRAFRLENYASIEKQVLEPFKHFANREYGKFTHICEKECSFFVSEYVSECEIQKYIKHIKNYL